MSLTILLVASESTITTTTIASSPSSSSQTQQAPNELHLVTKDGQQCFVWRSNQLTYIAPNRKELPLVLAKKFGHLATKLDLSYNNLTSFKNINLFSNLNELVLDNNCLEDDELDFRQNLRLKTLSLNKNKLCDLSRLIISIKVSFPNLEFLSLIGNPFCPIKISPHYGNDNGGGDRTGRQVSVSSSFDKIATRHKSDHLTLSGEGALVLANEIDVDQDLVNQKYRYFIINHLPNLHFLDSSPIGPQERDAALNSCFWVENIITNDGRQSSIIWGQTLRPAAQNHCPLYSYKADDILTTTTPTSTAHHHHHQSGQLQVVMPGGKQVAVYRGENRWHGQQEGQDLAQNQNPQNSQTTKGQLISRQVKCQMIGGFAIARTLLWTFLSLTSPTNLVHCSGTILALSLKGLGANIGSNKKKR